MITAQQAENLAHEWIAAWNAHDLDAIMGHYTEDVEFYSPVMVALKVNELGKINGKAELRKYFVRGLAAYPELRFELRNVYAGVNSIVVDYISVNNRFALEVFELNEAGYVKKVLCNYIVGQ